MVQRAVRRFRVFVPVVVVLGLLTTIWTPMPSAFAAKPTFTSVTPSFGSVTGGTAIYIVGTNFKPTGSTNVTIGGSAATSVVVTGTTSLTAVTPSGSAGAKDIVITTTGGGGGTVTVAGAFTYIQYYTVTYNGNSNTGGMVPVDGSSPYASGGAVTVLGNTGMLVKTGYVFTNWNTVANGSGTPYSTGNTFGIGANTILYAQWAITFTVTYNANGATGGSVPVDGTSPYASGVTVTVLGNTGSLVKTGNTFANWNTAANGSGTSYAPSGTFGIGANTILYAQWRAAVIYNGNGATGGSVPVDAASPYLNGAIVTVLGNTGSLVKTGYTFANWNTAADGSGTSFSVGNTFGIAADTVLYAQWAVITYTVTYNANGATSGTAPVDGSSPYASGTTVTVLGNSGSLVKTGYGFANWNTAADGSGTSYAPSASFTIGANTILYAQWATTYTVTYNGNAKTGGSSPTEGSIPYASGATVTVLGNTGDLVKTGNTFDNWNTAADGSGTSYAGGDTFVIGTDTILYAQWRAAVTYDGNGSTGGTVPVDGSSPYLNGSTVTVLGNTGSLVKAGYSFDNWNTSADGSGTSYATGNTFAIGANTILYAQWTVTNSVTYNANGATSGTVPVDGLSPYANGASVTVLSNSGSLARIGNTFANWNTAANGSGTSYAPSGTFTIGTNTILYAQWRTTVTYSGNGSTGGTVPVDASSPYLNGSTVSVLGNTGSLVKADGDGDSFYIFANWNTAADGSGTPYAPSATFVVAIDTVLYAQWTAISYTVTYDANGSTGGTIPVDVSSPYLDGSTVTVLGNTGSLVKTGYVFTHWNTAADGSGTSYAPSDTFVITDEIVLYPEWSPVGSYTVTYSGNGSTGGTVPVDGSSPYLNGATVSVLGNTGSLVRTDNTFANWNSAADGSGTSYAPAATFSIAVSTILYAQWKVAVIYNGNGSTGGTVPVDASSPYLNGTTVSVLGNSGTLVRTGNTFANWNTAADGSGTSYAPSATFAISIDTVLYAQWSPIGTYTVTYNGNGSTGGTIPVDGSSPYFSGTSVTILSNSGSLVRTGNTFANWNTAANGSGTAYTPTATFSIAVDTVLYAQWRTAVTYNGNGSTGGTVPVDGSSPYLNGAHVTVLGNTGSLVRTGYTFTQWNSAADDSGSDYAPGDTFAIAVDTVMYAKWAPIGSYTVGYNGNGSTGGIAPVDGLSPYVSGATVTVLGNTGSLVKSHDGVHFYTLDHWNTAADGSGTSYAPAVTFIIGANTILYAQWRTSLTYDANGATGGSVPVDGSSPYPDDATVSVLGNSGSLVKTGYLFADWNTAGDGSGTSYAPTATFIITASTVLYAQWTTTYTVVYNANGATGGSVPVDGSSPYASGATVTVLGNSGSLVKTGYSFADWNTAANGTGTSYAPADTFAIGANTILYAQWATTTYTITYNSNANTSGSVPIDGSSPYINGTTVTVLGNTGLLIKTGYIFADWNTVADGSGTSYSVGNTFAIAVDTILYAQWAPLIFTITYNGNGSNSGTVPVDGSSPYPDDATVSVLTNSGSLFKTGYIFAHWNTAADGSGTSYAPSATFLAEADITLYAQWTISYTVIYDANGATDGTVPVNGANPYLSGATVGVLGNIGSLIKTGNIFADWNTAADGSGTSYGPAATFSIGSNTIFYAQWRATITYNANGATGGSVPADGSSPYLNGSTVTVLGNSGSLVRTGYTFDHWCTSPDNSGQHYLTSDTFAIAADTVLYAQWAPIGSYLVSYNDNGSTSGTAPVDGSSPYLSGSTVTVLGNSGSLAKSGSTFVNWNTKPDGSGTSYAPSATITIGASIFLYAQWTTNSYTIAYNSNGSTGGSVPVDGSSPYLNGSTVSVLGNSGSLVRTGYVFAHWNTTTNGTGISYSTGNTFAIEAETILYAQWSIVAPPVPPVTSLPPIATIERPVTEVVRADATADTVVDATILGIGGIQSVVSVTIPAGAISRDITITITPAVGPAEISSGFITIRVTATDSSGTSVTQFNKPLIIDLRHVNAGASVIFSQDGIAWIPIQLLSGTALPDGMQEGYYLAADGHTIILTRHLTYFGVKKTQVRLRVLSSAYILKVGEHATLTTIGGSGSGVIGYVTTTPSICSVSDAGSVRALTAGVCIVEAMKSGVAAYMNVLSLPLNLTIQRLVQAPFTLISGTDILSVGGSSTLTTSGGSGDGVIKFSTTTPTYCSVSDAGLVRALVSGNCIVEATKAGNDTYLEASAWPMYLTIERVLSVPALSPTPGTTVNGGLLPKTGSPWYNLLALGIGLILLGGVGRARRKRSKPYSAS
jgi:LPXTG-motif cell wall-anchored protein